MAAVSKAQMIREAIAALGLEAELNALHSWIQEKYKQDIGKEHITQFRSNERRRQRINSGPKRIAGQSGVRSIPTVTQPTPAPAVEMAPLANAPLYDLVAVIELVKRLQEAKEKLGGEAVKQIVSQTIS